MSEVMYVGLDLETSGSDYRVHVPVQLGLAVDHDVFSMYVGWPWNDKDAPVWSEEAERIHGIEQHEPGRLSPPARIVDAHAAAWLYPFVADMPRMKRIPTGWNVAGFDMRFVDKHFPLTYSLLSYRTADLNALCFGLDGKGGNHWRYYKHAAKEHANMLLGLTEEERGRGGRHDAGHDAHASLHELTFLRRSINE